jgi:hypothetical protein
LIIRASRNGGSTSLADINTLTINGTIRIDVSDSNTLKVGDEIRLWPATTTLVGNPQFDMQNGVFWDTSRISEGVLVVKDFDTGVSPVMADKDPRNIYDMTGRLVRRQSADTSVEGLPAGIYIRGGRKIVVK